MAGNVMRANGGGVVDFIDLATFANQWLTAGP